MRKLFHVLATAFVLAASAAAGLSMAETSADRRAQQARTFPKLTPIYRISGIFDTGAGNLLGTATSVHCTNFGSSDARVQYVVRNSSGTKLTNPKVPLTARRTLTASTHGTSAFIEFLLTPGTAIRQGSMIIKATTPKVHCTAMIVDASASASNGVALSLTRLNQEKNAQE